MSQVFISYSSNETKYAKELEEYLKPTLAREKIEIWRDNRILATTPWDPAIKTALDNSQIVIVLFSQHCLNSEYITVTELPYIKELVDLGELKLLPVRLAPYHTTSITEELSKWVFKHQGQPKSSTNIVEDYALRHPGSQILIYHEILRDILQIFAPDQHRIVGSPPKFVPIDPPPASIHVIYDWMDRQGVETFVAELRQEGAVTTWDQDWASWEDYQRHTRECTDNADLILVYATKDAQHSRWILDGLTAAREAGKTIVSYVVDDNSHIPETLLNDCFIDATTVPILLNNLNFQLSSSQAQAPPRGGVGELLQRALEENRYLPSDTLTDRIFVSPEACRLTKHAYENRDSTDNREDRLRAILEYARLCRFRGDWSLGRNCLTMEPPARWATYRTLYAEYKMELGAFIFEMGDPDAGIQQIVQAYEQLRQGDVNTCLVKALRQLGNMEAEHQQFDGPATRLRAAIAFADHLRNRDLNAGEVSHAQTLLWLDCRRELAALKLRYEMVSESLSEFLSLAKEAKELEPDGEHFLAIINYHIGRVYHEHRKDDREAQVYFEKSFLVLQKYDNPIRLAFLCDHLGRLLARHSSKRDQTEALRMIRRGRKIREEAAHSYMLGKSDLSLGLYYRQSGDFQRSATSYLEAKNRLNDLGKRGTVATACQALGSVFEKMGRITSAREQFIQAKRLFRELNLEPKIHDVQYELFRLGRDLSKLSLADWLDVAAEADHVPTITEIGEYRFHQWIKEQVSNQPEGMLPLLYLSGEQTTLEVVADVDIGDDAAAIRTDPSLENFDIVTTTDAAPGSICRSKDPEQGDYAGKFSVVHTISDLAAMGATPVAILLNLYLTRDATLKYAMSVVKAVIAEASRYGVVLIGGDMKERHEQSVGCVGIGVVPKGKAVRRSTAAVGDIVAISLAKESDGSVRKIGTRWAQEILELRKCENDPEIRHLYDPNKKKNLLFTPLTQMIAACATGKVKSAIDTSDGFLACLKLLRNPQGERLGFELKQEWIEEAIDENVSEIARNLGLEPAQFLFNAGHDWEYVMTFDSEEDFVTAQKAFVSQGGNIAKLGYVRKLSNALKNGICYEHKSGGRFWIPFFTDEKFVSRSYEERPTEWEDLAYYLAGQRELTKDNEFVVNPDA